MVGNEKLLHVTLNLLKAYRDLLEVHCSALKLEIILDEEQDCRQGIEYNFQYVHSILVYNFHLAIENTQH